MSDKRTKFNNPPINELINETISWASPNLGKEVYEKLSLWGTSWASPSVVSKPSRKFADAEQIFNAIESLYLSKNKPRDRLIADRITTLYRDALEEDEHIISVSLDQFTTFFLKHSDLDLPKITLTPDGTLRVRWIQGTGSFTAIEFTGNLVVKLVAEILRECGVTAKHFSIESIKNIRSLRSYYSASEYP